MGAAGLGIRLQGLGAAAGVALVSLLAGCAGDAASLLTVGGVTGYTSANAILKSGYSETEIGPDQYRVRARGSSTTPVARLERIAQARAAQIGVEQGRKFVKIGPASSSMVCEDAKVMVHSKSAAVQAPVVEIEAVYAKTAIDAGYLPVADTFERLKAELAAESVDASAQAAALASAKAACGK